MVLVISSSLVHLISSAGLLLISFCIFCWTLLTLLVISRESSSLAEALTSRSKEERHWAAFTVNYAARSSAFSPFAAQATERLKAHLQGDSSSAECMTR